MSKVRVGIVGYGNIGRGVELSLERNADMELKAVFTRRNPKDVKVLTEGLPVISQNLILEWKEQIDVLILCGGTSLDLPVMGPEMAAHFSTVDSFDTHAKIPAYFSQVDEAAKRGNNIGLIAVGWDPGLFSLNRLYGESVLVQGSTYTFWGDGVSQGHSFAIRQIEGVKQGVQYSVPIKKAVEQARSGLGVELVTREKHMRKCYVVAEKGADLAKITETIKTMPDYFADYDTTVTFITEEEMKVNHSGMPHGGFVIRSGDTGRDSNKHVMEYSLKLDSNPEFTASVLVCYARAVYRLSKQGESGARTVFDIAPGLLSIKSAEELRAELL